MSMFCAISGEPAQDPVVSVKSGRVYEARLIRKYLAEHENQDPIDGAPLDPEHDLVTIASGASDPHGAVPPRGAHLTSIPALLTSLQSEYDSLLLEMVSLKRQYDVTRQELAAALYSNDASARVIARLMRERDEARDALASIGAAIPTTSASASASASVAAPAEPTDAEMADASVADSPALPADLAEQVDTLSNKLTTDRKGRTKHKAPAAYGGLSTYNAAKGEPLESKSSTTLSHPAQVSALYPPFALAGAQPGSVDLVTTDGNVLGSLPLPDTTGAASLAFALPAQPSLGHAAELPSFAVAASADTQSIHVVSLGDAPQVTATLSLAPLGTSGTPHPVALAVHPSHAFFVVGRGDAVAFFTPTGGDPVLLVHTGQDELITSAAFHPDGQLVATGTATGKVLVWDVKTGAQVAAFEPTDAAEPQAGHAVTGLAFSENGYTLASISKGSLSAIIWDLRKLAAVASLNLAVAPTAVAFDPNAQMLALAGPGELTLYASKGWKPILTSPLEAEATPTAVAWNQQSAHLSVVLSRQEDSIIAVYAPHSA